MGEEELGAPITASSLSQNTGTPHSNSSEMFPLSKNLENAVFLETLHGEEKWEQ